MPADRPSLDLNNLIAAREAGQVPAPTDEQLAARLRVAEQQSVMSRGVDLSIVKNKQHHQHRWVLMAQFDADDKTLSAMAEQRLQIAAMLANDERPDEDNPMVPIPMPMGQDNLSRIDGPGCVKCNTHWENPDIGYGKLCSVDDREWEGQRGAEMQGLDAMRQQNMARLVGEMQSKRTGE